MLREQLLLDVWFELARRPSEFVPVLPPGVSKAAVEPATPPHSDPGDDPGWPELRGQILSEAYTGTSRAIETAPGSVAGGGARAMIAAAASMPPGWVG